MIHTYKDTTIDFNITYKKRSDIAVYVDIYGQVEVQASKGTSDEAILRTLERDWDETVRKSKEMRDRLLAPFAKVYEPGEKFLYLGAPYPIVIAPNTQEKKDYVHFENNTICIYVKEQSDAAVKQALKRFYYQQCKAFVTARLRKYQPEFKMKPRSVSITDDERNWGTCDSERALCFSWKLAMAPIESIDYVVVHEMCHMMHMNHDRSFWRLVGKILPDYEKRRYWLALSVWRMNL